MYRMKVTLLALHNCRNTATIYLNIIIVVLLVYYDHMGMDFFSHCNIVQTQYSDMNPLKPCGACYEWLKKIAEVNPKFSVITFTDKDCNGIYVEEIDAM